MRPTVRTFRSSGGRRRERPIWGRSLIRRMAIGVTSGVLWALEGFDDGEDLETEEAEVFQGIGFYARPKKGHQAEAVVAKVGGESGHAVVVATRDQDALAIAGEGAEDETAIFNTLAIVRTRDDGTVEIGSHGGPFLQLSTKDDIDALRTWVAAQFSGLGHTHATPAGTTTSTTPVPAPGATPPNAAGTQKLRAE